MSKKDQVLATTAPAVANVSTQPITRQQENMLRLLIGMEFLASTPDDRIETEEENKSRTAVRQALKVMKEAGIESLYSHAEKIGAYTDGQLTGRGRSLAMAGFNSKTGPRKYTNLNFDELCAAQQPKGMLALLVSWSKRWSDWRKDHDFKPSADVAALFESTADMLYDEAGVVIED